MSGESEISRELLESVKDAVGRRLKLTLKRKVKLEVRGDKLESRVLALTARRGYILSTRVPSKIEQTFSYLDIQGISSNKPCQLLVEYDRGCVPLKLSSTEEVDEVIGHIGVNLQGICPGLSPERLMKKLSLKPVERLSSLKALWENQSPADSGPCGGFSHMYWCVCDQMGIPYREEVQWDVDTIYLTQDTRELNLQDFIHLENRDLVAITGVLEYNQWFTKLSLKDYKLSTDLCDQILRVVARSSRLEELVLENTGLKADFAQKLASALSSNPNSALHTLNFTNNSLEDKGIAALSPLLAKLHTGLRYLNLSRNSLSSKGVNVLAQCLCSNSSISNTLTHLDLSGNALRGDDIPHLWSFLGQPNCLQTLDLSCSDCPLDLVCSSLLRGSLKHLSVLNMSKSVFCLKKGKEVPSSFKQFFSSALALSTISLAGTKLPPDALKALLLGLASNPSLKAVSLDLSSCELRSAGAQILEGCIAEIPNISSLDISDNGFDSDLTTLLVWLSKNRSIRHLSLGKNFTNIKSKNLGHVLNNLVHMIQEEESPLVSLSLADSKLKSDLSMVLNALGSNSSLTRLDISGNGMGDMGAKMLAKALQINTKLRTVIWDKNNVSPQGLQDVAAALEKNYTIRFMPVPIIDAAQALKASPEKTEDALMKMEQYLLRNHETRRYLQGQAYRLQQGIVTSTTQQMIDRMCVKVQDHLNSLRYTESDSVLEDMRVAENLMKDARNGKTLLPSMYHLRAGWRGDDMCEGPCVSAIQEKLESMAGEVTSVIHQQLQGLLVSMVETADSVCPHVMKKANLRQELFKVSADKMTIPQDFVSTTLLEQSAVDIINKISEVKLSMASFLSDRIVDEILESLSHSQNTLAEHISRKGQLLLHQDSEETEVLDERILHTDHRKPTEADHNEELDSCLMTPQSKRKSILFRMTRPVSVAFEMEFDLDKALEDIPIHMEDPPPHQSTLEREPLIGFGDLPVSEGPKLQHITKLRPKRNKKSQPATVPAVCTAPEPEVEQNFHLDKLDEGVDEFFTRKVTKIETKHSSLKSPTPQEGDRRRESRMSGFFNLIKPRSATKPSPPSPHPAVTMPTDNSTSSQASVKSPSLPSPTEPVKTQSSEPLGSNDTNPPEEQRTTEHKTEPHIEKEGRDCVLIGRHMGVQVMGGGLLAEMKARQEKKSARPQRATEAAALAQKPEYDTGSPEITAQKDTRPEPQPRTHLPITPTKPSSPVPKPKPPLGPRTSGPVSPTPQSSHTAEGPSDKNSESPKVPLPAPRQKGALSVSEGEEQSSPLSESPEEEQSQSGEGSVFDAELDGISSEKAWAKQRSSLRSTANHAEENNQHQRSQSLPTAVGTLNTQQSAQGPNLKALDSDGLPSDPEENLPEGDTTSDLTSPNTENQSMDTVAV
ncbi:F-actin-uncapping protein LRRC16A isoform X2 [Chanos chanos]|uniref:F-actin-uncapping protein LRRC16A isoform X2 n=1 Tax=Chanos chanos TaxID=29144 RepID=A0A6J2WM29_CHACN|nr:F-actin-uncapping protein LRRC16A-like isoform X2 [Chanos chanos]